jgi:hypothetical protein
LTNYTRRAVIGGTMPKTDTLPVQIELKEADYFVLLKQAKRQTRVAARLIAVAEPERTSKRGAYLFTGYVTDGLALKAVAIVHAPKAVPAIDRALKRAKAG